MLEWSSVSRIKVFTQGFCIKKEINVYKMSLFPLFFLEDTEMAVSDSSMPVLDTSIDPETQYIEAG